MEFIYIGEIVNTHGIKGEVKILSDFKFKNDVLIKGQNIYIGKDKERLVVNSYRPHKIFDMVTFSGIDNINDILIYKGEKVYVKRDEITFKAILDEDLIGLKVYSLNKYIGDVETILKGVKNDNLVVVKNKKRNLIPNIKEFINKVDIKEGKIYINEIEGLINEN